MSEFSFDTILGRIDQLVNISINLPTLAKQISSFLKHIDEDKAASYEHLLKTSSIVNPPARQEIIQKLKSDMRSAFHTTAEFAVLQQDPFPHSLAPKWFAAVGQVTQSALAITTAVSLIDGYLTRGTIRKEAEKTREVIQHEAEETRQVLVTVFSIIHQDLERLDSRFHWGFEELAWRLDQQTQQTKDLIDILTRPLETQVRELRERGIECYNYGWYPEALSFLQEAMKKARIDYIVAQYLGNIYLYEKEEYNHAIDYFERAARYSRPKSPKHYVHALMSQAFSYYLRNQQQDLELAKSCLACAIDMLPGHLEARFEYAKVCALTGDIDECAEAIDYILHADPLYVVKILAEPDFSGVKQSVSDIINKHHANYRKAFAEEFEKHEQAISEIHRGLTIEVRPRPDCPPLGNFKDNKVLSLELADTVHSPGYFTARRVTSAKDKRIVTYRHPYDEDQLIQEYLQKIYKLASLYTEKNFLSSYFALKEIKEIPLPLRESGRLSVRFSGYWGGGVVTDNQADFKYWTIGAEKI